jgi:DNA-directed RNA polymerase omega subunit
MLYGRRLDEALEHVDGSRYALVHAVAKRARQITLWLTADPAELRAEAAPPPAPGDLASRDPVALSEAEILAGEVTVRWDPEGRADEVRLPEPGVLDTDPLLIEGLGGDDEDELEVEDDIRGAIEPVLSGMDEDVATPAAEADTVAGDDDDADLEDVVEDVDDVDEVDLIGEDGDDLVEVPLDSVDEDEDEESEEEED